MPPPYIPEALTYHQLVVNSVDFQDSLDTLNTMWSDAFNAWRNSIQRHDAQEVQDAYGKVYKSIKRRITLVTNRLHETRKERMNRDWDAMIQHLNSLRELVQDAQELRTTQGENAGGP